MKKGSDCVDVAALFFFNGMEVVTASEQAPSPECVPIYHQRHVCPDTGWSPHQMLESKAQDPAIRRNGLPISVPRPSCILGLGKS